MKIIGSRLNYYDIIHEAQIVEFLIERNSLGSQEAKYVKGH